MTHRETESGASSNAGAAQDFVEERLAPLAEEYEAERRSALARYRKRIPYGLAALVAVIPVALLVSSGFGSAVLPSRPMGGLVIFVATGILAYMWVAVPLNAHVESIRQRIYPHVFSFFGDDFVYSPSCPWSVSCLEDSLLIPLHDDETLEHHVRGFHKTVAIEIVEALLTEVEGSGRRKANVITFDGVLILLTVPSGRFGRILVKSPSGMLASTVRPGFADQVQDLESVRLEDPAFDDQFKAAASDPAEARRMLTAGFLERLNALSWLFGDGNTECCFFDDKLLIQVSTRTELFRPRTAREPADIRRDFDIIVSEMRIVFEIIEILGLDRDIWHRGRRH